MSKKDFTIPSNLRPPRVSKRLRNITGRTFTRVTVLGFLGLSPSGARWLCRCSCGQFFSSASSPLLRSRTKSCGCLNRERKFKHGHSRQCNGNGSYLYRIHKGIKVRCFRTSYHACSQYGGRGITIQESWLNFPSFLADILRTIGAPPTEKHSLDRINSNGNYEVGNVRWATAKEQCRNQRTNHRIMINGETKCLAEWLELTNTVSQTFRARRRRGYSLRQSLGLAPPPSRVNIVKLAHA